jgi:cell division septum initiation protein DivIVA
MCRLMPFWSSVFREANWSVRPVLQLRSPLEVALSLNRRNGIPLGLGCLIWLRHVLDAEAGTRGTRRAVVDWHDFLGDPRRTLERVGEQLDVVWPRWSDGALAEIDEFVSADMRRQRASDSDLQVHPAVNHLVREAYAAVRELVEDPASEKSERTLAGIRERFDGAAAIFGHAIFELEEGNRRAQSTGVALRNEYTAQLAAAREEFARQISEASTHVAEASTQLADVRGEFARQLDEARGEFARKLAEGRGELARQLAEGRGELARQLAEGRGEFARQLAEARREFARQLAEGRSECRRLVDEAIRDVARAEDAIVQLARRSEPRSASAPKRQFRDYLRPRRKDRKQLTAICNSGFFDPEFYLNSNPDVRGSGLDAACHYLVYGGREGRDPGPFFSTHRYLARFPDVAASGVNALVHYEMYGRHEMRKVPLSTL